MLREGDSHVSSNLPDAGQAVTASDALRIPSFPVFAWRVVALHILTYFAAGIAAYFLLDYQQAFQTKELRDFMMPLDSPWIAAGPALQVFRGFLFAAILYPLASEFVTRKRGGLLLWSLFVGLAILGTCGPSPSSLEGFLFTRLTLVQHLKGLPEVVVQTFLFSVGLVAWCKRPSRRKNILAGIGVTLVVLMSLAGVVDALRK